MANYPIYRQIKGSPLTFIEMDGNLNWLSTNLSGSNVIISGSTELSGRLIVSSGITGSLFGSSSWAVSASYAVNAISASYVSGSSAIIMNLTSSNDARINGLRIGRGPNNQIENTVVGDLAFVSNLTGTRNTAVGFETLYSNTTGRFNTAYGMDALYYNSVGEQNVAIGYGALQSNRSGSWNTILGGSNTGYEITSGSYNTILGTNSGRTITIGNNNTIIGGRLNNSYTPGAPFTTTMSDNVILGDGKGYIRYRFDGTQNNFYDNIVATGSITATQGFTGSLFGTSSWAISASWAPQQLNGSGYVSMSGTNVSYVSTIPNKDLANSSITIQGTSTVLGGTVNVINGTGFVKSTGTTISYDNSAYQATSEKGVANGYASLNSSAQIPSTQLPSYVDDVLEFANLASFPAIGETGKIYITLDTNKTYRWSGSTYVEISASPGSTDAVPEGSINLYFTTTRARDSVSFTAGSGAYNSTTGVFTIPTNTNQLTNGAAFITSNQTITLSGDISGTGTTSITTAIGANRVTNAMLSQVATATFKGRTTAATGNVEDLSATQATALLDVFSSTLKGLAPASSGGTTNFLRADGAWAAPTGGTGGGGTVTSVGGTGTVSGLTLTGTVTTSGNLTLGGILSLTSLNVTTALGFTPYNATNPSGYITTAQSYYIGTTLNALNRASAAQSLTGINIDGTAGSTPVLTTSGTLLTQQGDGTVIYSNALTTPQTGLFPATDNSNSILTVNRHPGNYYSQLGFSSNGNLYYRNFVNTAINTSQAWQTIWTSNSLTNLNQLTNGPGYTTNTGTVTSVATSGTVSGLTLTGGTITTSGTITLGGTLSLTSGNVTTALGFTPYSNANPSGYTSNTGTVTSVGGTGTVSGISLSGTVSTSGNLTLGGTLSLTSANVTDGLGYTPYNSTNPDGYVSNAADTYTATPKITNIVTLSAAEYASIVSPSTSTLYIII